MEAWGFRLMQHEHRFLDRAEVARRWFAEEYIPVMRMLHAADLVGSATDAEAYMVIASERYRLMRTHEWNDEVIEELRRKLRLPRRLAREGVSHGSAVARHALTAGSAVCGVLPGVRPAGRVGRRGMPGRPRLLPRRLCLGRVRRARGCRRGRTSRSGRVESAAPRLRLRPVDGSKTCSFRMSTHSRQSSPSLMRDAGSSRATTVSAAAPPASARPESRASSSSSATLWVCPSSRVK